MTLNEQRLTVLNEGKRSKPYVDTVGKITIGVGHNLTDNGLPAHIIDALLEWDYSWALADTLRLYPWSAQLDEVRRAVLVDLMFNMGSKKLSRFKNTLRVFEARDYEAAAEHLSQSLWYQQVGDRGPRILTMLRTGQWPAEILKNPFTA